MPSLDTPEDKMRLINLTSPHLKTDGERLLFLTATGLDELESRLPPLANATSEIYGTQLVTLCIKQGILKKTQRHAVSELLRYLLQLSEGHSESEDVRFLNDLMEPYLVKNLVDIKIKILWMAANPFDTPHLDFGTEQAKIKEQISGAIMADKIQYQPQRDVLLKDLRKIISHNRPQILHFSGHASANGLTFERYPDRNSVSVTKEDFVKYLK